LRVLDLILGHEPGTDRPESLAALALVPLAAAALDLEHALGYIVAQEISGNGVLCLVLRQIARPLANDDAEFDLPVELARFVRGDRVVVRPANAARGLVKDDRLLRNRHARFRRVVGIVESDGNEVADTANAGAKSRLAGYRLHPLEVCLPDFRKAARGEHLAIDVLHDA